MMCGGIGEDQIATEGHEIHEVCNSVKNVLLSKSMITLRLNKSKIYTKSGFYGAWQEYGSEVMFGGKGTGKSQAYLKPAFEETKGLLNAVGI